MAKFEFRASSNQSSSLFTVNIVLNTQCRCGALNDDVYYFLMECSNYFDILEILSHILARFNFSMKIYVNLLMSGVESLLTETNISIFDEVLKYIFMKNRNAFL